MIHLYCGDGKGKTTAAMGLALRAAGHGKRVVITQFLKSGMSGERAALAALPTVELLPIPETMKFTFRMTEAEKAAERLRQTELLHTAFRRGASADLLILDELCAALSTGMVPLSDVLAGLDSLSPDTEVVITGRDPAPELSERAHYITEMVKRRHPFDGGTPAREGVEF
ncbi:cob(I)yrinic acid a c-diamide adenosyltransferase [Flavonifractor sp. An92]|uniref:cob(I)yrinic acid a,c-diamide adenosyltransferase n=1 Tax=Flavonifractor sp. An92 TaxID=1965666 RepID=UPI000B36A1D0|nr:MULTISPECIES: cob(I)yrinic acid a,c-diamide adenosyltransferase [unclassified Flavonifractor]OUN06920.1 cob(I)yrinic acid a c-diamide adenosyltransferase [Flavonifractor sp. An92]OUQ26000.1 cob(I)yrinic acid a c-diamide adenosyltransferase [Flavonifractor sp. An135]